MPHLTIFFCQLAEYAVTFLVPYIFLTLLAHFMNEQEELLATTPGASALAAALVVAAFPGASALAAALVVAAFPGASALAAALVVAALTKC